MSDFFIIEPCASANGVEIKLKSNKIDLKIAEKILSKLGFTLPGSVVLVCNIDEFSLTVYGSGRIMVKTDKKLVMPKVKLFSEKIIKVLKEGGAIVNL